MNVRNEISSIKQYKKLDEPACAIASVRSHSVPSSPPSVPLSAPPKMKCRFIKLFRDDFIKARAERNTAVVDISVQTRGFVRPFSNIVDQFISCAA